MIPSTINDLIASYINVGSRNVNGNVLTKAKLDVQVLEQEIATLRERVRKHTELFRETDPDVEALEKRILSAVKKIESLGDKLYQDLKNSVETSDTKNSMETSDAKSVSDKIWYIEADVEPALTEFKRICIAETQDILKNVFDVNEEN